MNKRIFITGATGLIGRELATPLADAGFDVYALTIDKRNADNGFHWIHGNLFNQHEISDLIAEIRPEYLLNLAWATTGDYLSSSINYSFLSAGINLATAFAKHGGCRAVFAGTCLEYQFKNSPLRESDKLDPGKTNYTFCKNALREISERIFDSAGVSFAYGRIFYVYGKNEATSRLTGSVIESLKQDKSVTIKSGSLLKDYIYTKDIANSFVALTSSPVTGPVNICTGKAIAIRDYVATIARHFGREDLLVFKDEPSDQPPIIVGDNTRLVHEVGYTPRYTVEQAISEILNKNA